MISRAFGISSCGCPSLHDGYPALIHPPWMPILPPTTGAHDGGGHVDTAAAQNDLRHQVATLSSRGWWADVTMATSSCPSSPASLLRAHRHALLGMERECPFSPWPSKCRDVFLQGCHRDFETGFPFIQRSINSGTFGGISETPRYWRALKQCLQSQSWAL